MHKTYLAQVKSIVHFVLERSHLHLADELWFEMSVAKNGRQQMIEMSKKQVHLVVNSGVQSRQSKPVITEITVAEHATQQGNHQRPQDIMVCIAGIGKCVTEC